MIAPPPATNLYTPLLMALDEFKRRRADPELREKVHSYFESQPLPLELAEGPRAVIAPPIASPNLEFLYFIDICRQLPFPGLCYEFSGDKFVHLNYEKHYLGQLVFFREYGGIRKVANAVRVVDFNTEQGKPMSEVKTLHGENLVDFHHRLIGQYVPDSSVAIRDFSEWFKASRAFSPAEPYLRYLGLFICDAILFSNFVNEKYHSPFTQSHVIPAFKALEHIFGVSPLIVPIAPIETDTDAFWCYYPEQVSTFL